MRGSRRWRRKMLAERPLEPGCPICDPDGYLDERGGYRGILERAFKKIDSVEKQLEEAVENQELAA